MICPICSREIEPLAAVIGPYHAGCAPVEDLGREIDTQAAPGGRPSASAEGAAQDSRDGVARPDAGSDREEGRSAGAAGEPVSRPRSSLPGEAGP